MNENTENEEKANTRKRQKPGRPKVEKTTVLTGDMEIVAQRMHTGMTVEEIADDTGIKYDMVVRQSKMAIVQNRVKL